MAELTVSSVVKHTEKSMIDLIHARWAAEGSSPRYLVAEHVNEGAGFSYNRTLDAVVLDTWPSSGLQVHGIEVKVSKSDLRRELQDISKAAAFYEHIDLFSIVAPAEVADLSLLPPKWGLYVPDGKGSLKVKRKPLSLHDDIRKTVSMSFMASFVRALHGRGAHTALISKAYKEGQEMGRRNAQYALDRLPRQVEEFEKASGIKITDGWSAGAIGEAVKFVMSTRTTDIEWQAESLRRVAEEVVGAADVLEKIRALESETTHE